MSFEGVEVSGGDVLKKGAQRGTNEKERVRRVSWEEDVEIKLVYDGGL